MNNEIKRYDQWLDEAYQETPIVEYEDGQYCIYEDIKPIIEELRNKIMILEDDNCMLRGKVNDLLNDNERLKMANDSLEKTNYMLVEQRR
jgi:hypothetical protein